MPKIEMYTTMFCPYCTRAKYLLEQKGQSWQEYSIEGDRKRMKEMLLRSQRNTVPQIFINDQHIGGYDDLAELDDKGELDELLIDG
ncbi:MAG: glutaredoxin 3 [gamma proteobacterium symbiont of Bathyaustriella thionipta]|nr:glutaredoxin 3 [gamma proteobacterium symbiont of Bathyaustriella thionipta]